MRKFGRILRNNIVVGLVLVAPIAITLFIVHFLVRLVANFWVTKALTDLIFNWFPHSLQDKTAWFTLSQVIAVILVLGVLFLIGFFVRSFFGRRLYALAERVLVRIPVFNRIYVHVRRISETVFAQRETMFKQVALIEYPRQGLYSMAFVTSAMPDEVRKEFLPEVGDDPQVAVFVPTTPNPTSGMLIFLPKSALRILPITVAEAMQLVVSAGAVYPGDDDPTQNRPTLLDKLEQWITRQTDLEPVQSEPAAKPPSAPPGNT